MTHAIRRFIPVTVFALVAAGGLYLGASSTARADDEVKACTTKDFKTKEVKKACADGGQKAAKDLMKKLVKKAKAAGDDINCKSCHKSLKTFELTDGAVAKLKKLL
jgi:hypothetical protein